MAKRLTQAQLTEIKINFNDICLREMGLDINDDDYLYDIDTESIYKVKDKFIKYSEEEFPVIHANEIELNLFENPRLMEILFGMWIVKWATRKNVEVTSFSQIAIRGSNTGFFNMTYVENGEAKEIKSDVFINESLRIFNLITILNHRNHIYDVSQFNIEIPRKDRK